MKKSINNEQKIYIINSTAQKSIIQNMKLNGYKTLSLPALPGLNRVEGPHPDMQMCKISQSEFICAPGIDTNILFELDFKGLRVIEGGTKLSSKYPYNIAYNILIVGTIIFHNLKYTDLVLLEELKSRGYDFIHIKQGYAACSSIVLHKKDGGILVMTGDPGIRDACQDAGLEILWCKGIQNVKLKGYDHGFIGGCCGFDEQKLFTCGHIEETLENASEVLDTIKDAGIKVISLCSGRLKDIGGIIIA